MEDLLMELLGEDFGSMVTIFNPMYPLQFERFGDGNPDGDPEFKSHIASLERQAHEVSTELGVEECYYASVEIYKAEKKARMAYAMQDPVGEAKKALKISPHCPEAYNVMAQFEAKTYDEALEFYNKAVEVAPNVSRKFRKELSKGKCWSLNHLRSYFRAVHGQANTLRKMGRYQESLQKYLELEKLDSKFYSWSSFANWRYHVLEVYMKMGDDEGALKFALKKSNAEAFELSSSCGAWFWTKALLDYRYKKQRGFAEDFFDKSDDPKSRNVFSSFQGTILRAFQASPVTLQFLTGERQLPNCRIPFHMGNWASLSNVGSYCMSNAELWHKTPGALQWAARNARTFMCSLILDQDKASCKKLGIKCNATQFGELLSKGIFLDARVCGRGKTLVHVATCNDLPQILKMLLNAGAKVHISGSGWRIPTPLHMACYYNFNPKLIQILCDAGADPTDKCGFHYSPLQMAAEQGAIRAFNTAFECLPAHLKKDQKVLDSILLAVFQSSCYECVTGIGNPCQRCLGGDSAHPPDATWTGVLDFLTELNYKPAKKYLESMTEFPGKRRLFAYYSCKLRGEEPNVIAEGPGLSRKPLSLMQPSNLSNILSALGQFGDSPHDTLQKKLQSSKAILPKSATCEYCKEREKKMMVCGQCRQTYYCSRECQKKNWKEHKKSCSPRRD